jgi:hypothetical protein
MPGAMDLVLLRQLVGGVIATLKDYYTHEKLGEACERLGLPGPPGLILRTSSGPTGASCSGSMLIVLKLFWPRLAAVVLLVRSCFGPALL